MASEIEVIREILGLKGDKKQITETVTRDEYLEVNVPFQTRIMVLSGRVPETRFLRLTGYLKKCPIDKECSISAMAPCLLLNQIEMEGVSTWNYVVLVPMCKKHRNKTGFFQLKKNSPGFLIQAISTRLLVPNSNNVLYLYEGKTSHPKVTVDDEVKQGVGKILQKTSKETSLLKKKTSDEMEEVAVGLTKCPESLENEVYEPEETGEEDNDEEEEQESDFKDDTLEQASEVTPRSKREEQIESDIPEGYIKIYMVSTTDSTVKREEILEEPKDYDIFLSEFAENNPGFIFSVKKRTNQMRRIFALSDFDATNNSFFIDGLVSPLTHQQNPIAVKFVVDTGAERTLIDVT